MNHDRDIIITREGTKPTVVPPHTPASRKAAVGTGVVLSRAHRRAVALYKGATDSAPAAFDAQVRELAEEFERDGLTRVTIITIALLAEALRAYSEAHGGCGDG